MGKVLVIKNSNFSENAITTVTNKCSPTTVFDLGFWNYQTGLWYDRGRILGRNCNTRYLRVVGGKKYTINNPPESMHYDVVFLNANKEHIGYIGGDIPPSYTTGDLSLTTPSNCSYLCFNLYTGNTISSNPPAVQINGITITGATADALVYEE